MNVSKSFKPYRAADYVQSPEEAAEYLNAAIADGHPAVLLKALRNVADSTGGMSQPELPALASNPFLLSDKHLQES